MMCPGDYPKSPATSCMFRQTAFLFLNRAERWTVPLSAEMDPEESLSVIDVAKRLI